MSEVREEAEMEELISVTAAEYMAAQIHATKKELQERDINPEGIEGRAYANFTAASTKKALDTMRMLQKRREEME